MAKPHRPIEVGTIFGQRKVIGPHVVKDNHWHWPTQCVCGSIALVRLHWLERTDTCGCIRPTKHGMARHPRQTPEYVAYYAMIQRCNGIVPADFKNYTCRGIRVCPEWLASFPAFYEHVGPRPGPGYTIDRINNDKGYEPENVRWATQQEQGRNRRNNRRITVGGETHCAIEWDEIKGYPKYTVSARLMKGWSEYDAVMKPRNMRYSRPMKQFYQRAS